MRAATLIVILGALLLLAQASPDAPLLIDEPPGAAFCVEADEDALSDISHESPVATHGDVDLGMTLHATCAHGRTARHPSNTAYPTPLRLCVLRC